MAAIAQKWTEEIKESFCELTAWECKYQSWIDYNIYMWFVKLQTWDYKPTESLRGEALKGFLYDFEKRERIGKWLEQHSLKKIISDAAYQEDFPNESEDLIQTNGN